MTTLRMWCAHIITLVSSTSPAPALVAIPTTIATLPLDDHEEGDKNGDDSRENGGGVGGTECSVVGSEEGGSEERGGEEGIRSNIDETAATADGATEAQERLERLGEEREEVKRLLKALSALLQGFSTSKID